MGRPGGRRGSCGTVGPPASGQRATARVGAWQGCEHAGFAPALPRPTACVRAGRRLAPRGSVMTEPPRAAGGRRAEGWAYKAFAVGFSRR